jgi:hypothetical protein
MIFIGRPIFQANRTKNIGAIMDKVPWGITKIPGRQTDAGNRGEKLQKTFRIIRTSAKLWNSE